MARRRQQAVPDQELLLLAHRHQQVDSSCAGLGWRVPVQGVLQRCQVQPGVLSGSHLQATSAQSRCSSFTPAGNALWQLNTSVQYKDGGHLSERSDTDSAPFISSPTLLIQLLMSKVTARGLQLRHEQDEAPGAG